MLDKMKGKDVLHNGVTVENALEHKSRWQAEAKS